MRKAFWAFLLIGISIIISVPSFIFAEDDSEEQYDDEVVITATRTPQNSPEVPSQTEVISQKEIEDNGSNTVSDALTDNGQIISSYGGSSGSATVNIDGCSSSQTLVLINGIPANGGVSGTVDFSFIPVVGVKKIEVVHGPLSSLYGANAIGGVVNVITDLTGDPQTVFNIQSGSNYTNQAHLLYQQSQWGIAIGGSITDGYLSHSNTDNGYFLGQYDFYNHDDEYLVLHTHYLSKNAELPGYKNRSANYGHEKDNNFSMDLSGRTNLWNGNWEYKIFKQDLYLEYNMSHHQSGNLGADIAGIYTFDNHVLLGGVMIKRESYNSTDSGVHTLDSQGVYLQDTWSVLPSFQIVGGLRWDHNSSFESPINPRITFIEKINEQLTLKAGYGKAYRSPTVNDLYYYYPDPQWPAYGNPNLKPEEGERFDIIGEYKINSQKLSINLFESQLRNGIDWDYSGTPLTVANVYKNTINGINLVWENAWSNAFSTRLSYQWLNKTKWKDQTQNTSAPDNFFGTNQLGFAFNWNNDPWQGEVDLKICGGRSSQTDFDTSNPVNMPDYSKMDLNLSYRYNKNTKFSFTANNVFNQQYDINYGYLMPGREYYLGLQYTF